MFAATRSGLEDARHLLGLFGDPTRRALAQIRGCNVIMDVCLAAEEGLLKDYSCRRLKVRKALGFPRDEEVSLPAGATVGGVRYRTLLCPGKPSLCGGWRGNFYPWKELCHQEALSVSDNFKVLMLGDEHGSWAGLGLVQLVPFDLQTDAGDEAICQELPKGYVFPHTGALCAIIKELVTSRELRERGVLLDDGRENVFYGRGGSEIPGVDCTVIVFRRPAVDKWYLDALPYNSALRLRGCRIFAPEDRNFPIG